MLFARKHRSLIKFSGDNLNSSVQFGEEKVFENIDEVYMGQLERLKKNGGSGE